MKTAIALAFTLFGCTNVSNIRIGNETLFSSDCAPRVTEKFIYEGQTVSVSREHCIDKMGPDADGRYEVHYDYEFFEFSLGATSLQGRAYADAPDEAHFLRVQIDGSTRLLTPADLLGIVALAAAQYFRGLGKTQLSWLDSSNQLTGYSPIP
jgi:hypothetical protein